MEERGKLFLNWEAACYGVTMFKWTTFYFECLLSYVGNLSMCQGCTNMLLSCWNIVGSDGLHLYVLEGINKLARPLLGVAALCLVLLWRADFPICSWCVAGRWLHCLESAMALVHPCLYQKETEGKYGDIDQLHLKWPSWNGVVWYRAVCGFMWDSLVLWENFMTGPEMTHRSSDIWGP